MKINVHISKYPPLKKSWLVQKWRNLKVWSTLRKLTPLVSILVLLYLWVGLQTQIFFYIFDKIKSTLES